MDMFYAGSEMDIANIWNNEKQIKIATGLTYNEANELNALRFNPNSNSNNNDGRPRKLDTKGLFLMLMLRLSMQLEV